MHRPQPGLDDFLVEAPCTLDFMLWKLTLKLFKFTQSYPFFTSTVLKLVLLPQHPLSYMTSKNLSSCPHACITNSLSTKPSISSPKIMFGRYTGWSFFLNFLIFCYYFLCLLVSWYVGRFNSGINFFFCLFFRRQKKHPVIWDWSCRTWWPPICARKNSVGFSGR